MLLQNRQRQRVGRQKALGVNGVPMEQDVRQTVIDDLNEQVKQMEAALTAAGVQRKQQALPRTSTTAARRRFFS